MPDRWTREASDTMTITPYLYYRDVDASLEWLTNAFGFERNGAPNVGPDGKARHAALRLGEGQIMLGSPGSDYKNPKTVGHATQSLHVMVDDADEHFMRARRAGARILEEPFDTPYGHRRYAAEDPEGHHWYFAHDPSVQPRAHVL